MTYQSDYRADCKSGYRAKAIWQGVLWKILSCGCFAGINAIVRYITGGSPLEVEAQALPVYTIMFFQHLIGASIILPCMLVNSKPLNKYSGKYSSLFATKYPGLHMLRIITAALGVGMWYLSLRYIPIMQVVALSFITPIITLIGAIVILKEQININKLAAIALSMIGSFLIVRPDLNLQSISTATWILILPLLATLFFALDKLISRKLLAMQESPTNLTFYLLAFMSPICLVPLIWYGWVTPTPVQLSWLIILGILSSGAHYAFHKAFALAEITFLMPFGMTKIILCSLVSYFAFFELPNSTHLWIGIIVLTLSTVILSFGNRKYE